MTGAGSVLARGLQELGCQALVILGSSARDPDLASFTGPVHLHSSLVVVPLAGAPRLSYTTPMERDEAAATGLALLTPEELELVRWSRELPTAEALLAKQVSLALERCGVAPSRVAVAGQGEAGVLLAAGRLLEADGWTLVAGNDLARRGRKAKGERELRDARRVASGACTAQRRVAELLAATVVRPPAEGGAGDGKGNGNSESVGELWLAGERLKVGRLRLEIARTLAAFGLEQPVGNIVAPAEEGAVPHSAGDDERVLRAGESLVVDLYPRGWIFADCTRTFCVGPPPEPLAAAHAALMRVLARIDQRLRARREDKPLRAFALQDATCTWLNRDGYATPVTDPGTTEGYVHNLGHGVGFELHEYPSFRREAGEEGLLATGDLITIEPGLYSIEQRYGLRLEDEIYLGPDGPETLTPLPYDLDPRAW
jgi:Xaa-Pro aminopeptidase